MTSTTLGLSRIGFALLLGVSTAQGLYAAPACSNKNLKGVYGMLATGTNIVAPPPAPLGPIVWAGRVEADGSGNMFFENTASYNGVLVTESYDATYVVDADCNVEIRPVVPLPIGPGGALVPITFDLRGAVADNGDDVAVIVCGIGAPCFQTPFGAVLRLHLRRQDNDQSRCRTRDFSGAFQLDLAGTVIVGGPVAGPVGGVGRLVFDGRGGFGGQAAFSFSGLAVLPLNFVGTYSVDSRCSLTMDYVDQSGTPHMWTGTLIDRSNGADVIVHESGIAVAGTLKKQRPQENRN